MKDGRLKTSLEIIGIFIIILWGVEIIDIIFPGSFHEYGIFPRETSGLIGIILAPLIHADFLHLFSNTVPLFFLGLAILYFYPKSSGIAIIIIYLLTGGLVWLLARSSYHIGASGIVYGFAAFLFFSGVFRKDVKSIALALLVAFIYGGLVWGVLPVIPGVSWESHLFGAASGTFAAYVLRKYDKQKKYDWENEKSDIPKEKLEISYKKGYPWDES